MEAYGLNTLLVSRTCRHHSPASLRGNFHPPSSPLSSPTMDDDPATITTDFPDHQSTATKILDHNTTTTDPLTPPTMNITLHDLTPELGSIHDLATLGSWRTIIDKIIKLRKLSLSTFPHHHLTYASYYLLSLTKLRRYDDVSLELSSLHSNLDSPEYLYQSYPDLYPNRSGSMVPFSIRWIHAQHPLRLGQRNVTLDRFYALLDFVRGKIEEKEKEIGGDLSVGLWRKREGFVVGSIIGLHLGQKEFNVCLDLIKRMIEKDGFNPVLLSKLGYVQMQLGDLEGAKAVFGRVESLMGEGKIDGVLSEVEFKNLVDRNKALMYVVAKDYVSAVREYDECIERDGSDVVAINNKAICLMYLRDLSDSIKVLENALERVPTVALDETVVVNLCSMYELAYVNHSDVKKTLSNWIARVAPDDFDSSCTRT